MQITRKLTLTESLPLTCSRRGSCCFGKAVWLNPWELAQLADAKGCSPRQFRDTQTEFGGIRLKFNGMTSSKNMRSCSLYDPHAGCTVHSGRPLACRLFPLGLHRQGTERCYIFHGKEFPCLEECSEVQELPYLTVEQYVEGQLTAPGESAQNLYLDFMESLADGAFALLLDSGLAESGDRRTLQLWKKAGKASAGQLANSIPSDWLDLLMVPDCECTQDPKVFVAQHHTQLQKKAQEMFGSLDSIEGFRDGSVLMMKLALHVGKSLGANPFDLVDQWINTAKENGAQD